MFLVPFLCIQSLLLFSVIHVTKCNFVKPYKVTKSNLDFTMKAFIMICSYLALIHSIGSKKALEKV
jgi:hypothetical protein